VIDIEQKPLGPEDLAARLVVTMQYKVGTVNVNGVDHPAVDFLDGGGWHLVDMTPYVLAAIEEALRHTPPKVHSPNE
jgi:hypothetical protein